MSTHFEFRHQGPAGCTDGAAEEAVNLYVDGELPLEHHADLFAHLAQCEACRRTLDSVIKFRRYGRDELLTVPPALDEAFLGRLASVKSRHEQVDRAEDRGPLWTMRRPVSLGSGALAAILVFVAGLLLSSEETVLPTGLVVGEQERLEFADTTPAIERPNTLYVFYPGLTIEAPKLTDESAGADPL